MGFFSFECEGCGHPLLPDCATGRVNYWMTQGVAVTDARKVIRGLYDGYGRLLGCDEAFPGQFERLQQIPSARRNPSRAACSIFHEDCWQALGRPGFVGPARQADDQGFFFDPADHSFASPLNSSKAERKVRLRRARIRRRTGECEGAAPFLKFKTGPRAA